MTNTTDVSGLINKLNSTANAASATQTRSVSNNGQVGKDEFLKMLITQLKNQDPLNPMDNQQFAVDLAQFNQLDQLMQINKKIGSSSTQDSASLAGYLGTNVKIKSNAVQVANKEGGEISFNLSQDATDVTVALLDSNGKVVESKDAGAMKAGGNTFSLTNLSASDGSYTVKVQARTKAGVVSELDAYTSGIVNGFIPGADPKLLIGQNQYSPSDILEVRMAK